MKMYLFVPIPGYKKDLRAADEIYQRFKTAV